MKKELYTISAGLEHKDIKVMATGHRQHIWNETTLTGVSKAGIEKLDAFFKAHEDERITVNAGTNNPRLVGYEPEI